MRTQLVQIALACVVAAAGLAVGDLAAQPYPSRPIRVIDAYPPGGSTDVVARIIAAKFQESTGQPWIVDNRAGAQGIIGTEIVARAAPDGYTLLMFTGAHTVHPSIYAKMPYDLLRDFAPVTLTSATTNLLVVHPTVPAKSVKELIAMAKAKPSSFNYSSAGTGSTTHMAMELFKSMARVDLLHIPYKGSAPAVLDLVGGHVDLMFAPLPVMLPHIKSGRVRPLAVATAKRSGAIPEIPTVAEAGLPGFEATNSVGVLAPAVTPRDIIAKLNAEIVRILGLPEIRDRLLGLGAEPVANSPEQFAAFLKEDIARWAKVVKDAKIPLQTW
ncbi:MAG: tripartite tricarboxylate transporter substrate binding protein [Betaproteobacteria bacterium]|nr:tripartite tricarboxylate transporter substrate binding protein [Betaproteobacteria bacterium]MBI3056112.1 tripartite tricarboxylate transporter substrate binding protein [Betaproteobacteria bacterium]